MSCSFQSDDGSSCDARPMKSGKYCFFHSPDANDEKRRLEAQSRGGKANAVAVQTPLPPITISNAQDVVKLLEETINQVRGGILDVKIGNCIGVLSGHLIKAIEVSSIATRVEFIERAIFEKRTRL